MINVTNRSVESWGPLASVDQKEFNILINETNAKDKVKEYIKQQKKLKPYKVTFKKAWHSDAFQIMAENEHDVSSKAREYFKQNSDSIGFKEGPRSMQYAGYDTISYWKVR